MTPAETVRLGFSAAGIFAGAAEDFAEGLEAVARDARAALKTSLPKPSRRATRVRKRDSVLEEDILKLLVCV
jgi:hypothetical protein